MIDRSKKTTGGRKPGARNGAPKSSVELRIIAGQWRGRRWRFVAAEGVRPTPDRVRETLFNWLAPRIGGARCLDLFAGSGALGLEALSRGAARVCFVDSNRAVIEALRGLLSEWRSENTELQVADALSWLKSPPTAPYDIVFVDPPFAAGLVAQVLDALRANRWLAPQALLYLEQPASAPLPSDWPVHRAGRAGAVGYYLLHES
jgi:16S rRNA (guanine966-N2)-methyltransferase